MGPLEDGEIWVEDAAQQSFDDSDNRSMDFLGPTRSLTIRSAHAVSDASQALFKPASTTWNALTNPAQALKLGEEYADKFRSTLESYVDASLDAAGVVPAIESYYKDPWIWESSEELKGTHVVTIQGFGEAKGTMKLTEDLLRRKGATQVVPADIRFNAGSLRKRVKDAIRTVEQAYKNNGGKPVVLVVHSMGGPIGFRVMKKMPHMIAGMVTEGSPFDVSDANGAVRSIARKPFLTGLDWLLKKNKKFSEVYERIPERLRIPMVNIFSRRDKVTTPEGVVYPGRIATLESTDTHCGMPFGASTNRSVFDGIQIINTHNLKTFSPDAFEG